MYEDGVAALVARVRQLQQSDWTPTPKRRASAQIASQLDELACLLESDGAVQFDIEAAHDAPGPGRIGTDGLRVPEESWGCSYKGTIRYMRDLAETARRVAAELPDPRSKPAAPFAALALLHLRYRYGFPRPTLYADGPCVSELRRVLESANIVLSPERVRNVLAAALRDFDPHFVPLHVEDLLP